MSIEILKRRIPKDEPRDHSTIQTDPTAQRKRAIISAFKRISTLLSGQPIENNSSATAKRTMNDNSEQNLQKKIKFCYYIEIMFFKMIFVPSYNDTGPKMTTTEDKPRPRIYAVKKYNYESTSSTATANNNNNKPEIKTTEMDE